MSDRKNDDFPKPYQKLWRACRPLLQAGRPSDLQHARETARLILDYRGRLKLDYSVLVPVAMMHDIGHIAILPEHFAFVTGPKKIANAKLVHMLAGAKIARDVLEKLKYDRKKIAEITDIISMHDADQIRGVDLKVAYNSRNKKIFHDIDALDRYTEERIRGFQKLYPRAEFLRILSESADNFFFTEFKELAAQRLKKLISV
jgi:hypothetical protein